MVRRCILFVSSVERWYIFSLMARRYISFLPPVEHWCILLSPSSVIRRCISLHTFSGTLVYFIVNVTTVYPFSTSSGTLVYLIILIVNGTSMYIFLYHQWNDGIFYR